MGEITIVSAYPPISSGGVGPLALTFSASVWPLGQAFLGGFAATGGSGGGYVYSLSAGSLPTSLSGPNSSTGKVTGTPTAAGAFTFTGHVVDSASNIATLQVTLTISTSVLPPTPVANVTSFTATPNFYPTVPFSAQGGQQWTITIAANTPSDPNFLWGQLVLKPQVDLLSVNLTSGATSMTINNNGVITNVAATLALGVTYLEIGTPSAYEIVKVTAVSYPTAFTEQYTIVRGQFGTSGTAFNIGTPFFNLSNNGQDFISGLPVINAGLTTSNPVTGPPWAMGYPTYFIAYCDSTNTTFIMNPYPIPPTGGSTPVTPQTLPFLVEAATGSTVGAETPNVTSVTITLNTYPTVPLSSVGQEQWNITLIATPPINATTGQVDSRFTDAQSILKPAKAVLAAAITSTSATSISITNGASYPFNGYLTGGICPIATNDYIQVDTEIMKVTGGAGTSTLTVTRGQQSTTAATHVIASGVFDLSDNSQDVVSGPPRLIPASPTATGPMTTTGPNWLMGSPAWYIFYLVSQDDGVYNIYPVWNVTPQTTPTLVEPVTGGHLNLTIADPTSTNDLVNGNFSATFANGANLEPSGWSLYFSSGGNLLTNRNPVVPAQAVVVTIASLGWSASAYTSGANCLQILSDAATSPALFTGVFSSFTPCNQGQQFTATIAYGGGSSAPTLSFVLKFFEADGSSLAGQTYHTLTPSGTPDTWLQDTLTYTAPVDSAYVFVGLATNASGSVYVNNIQLTGPYGSGLGVDGSGNTSVVGLTIGNFNPGNSPVFAGSFTIHQYTGGSPAVTNGSTTLTITTSLSSNAVQYWFVTGPGIQPGTYVASNTGTSVTLSLAASIPSTLGSTLTGGSYTFVQLPLPSSAAPGGGSYPQGCWVFNENLGGVYPAGRMYRLAAIYAFADSWIDVGDPGDATYGIVAAGVVYAGDINVGQLTAGTATFSGTVTFANGSGPQIQITSTDVTLSTSAGTSMILDSVGAITISPTGTTGANIVLDSGNGNIAVHLVGGYGPSTQDNVGEILVGNGAGGFEVTLDGGTPAGAGIRIATGQITITSMTAATGGSLSGSKQLYYDPTTKIVYFAD